MRIITITGNLGRDAETITLGNAAYTSFSVCSSKKRKDAQGNPTDKTIWFKCLRRQVSTGDPLLPYLTKGCEVTVSGEFDTNEWHDNKTGKDMLDLKVYVSSIELHSRPAQQQLPTTGHEQTPYTPQHTTPNAQSQQWPYQGGFHPAPPAGQQSVFPPDQPPY